MLLNSVLVMHNTLEVLNETSLQDNIAKIAPSASYAMLHNAFPSFNTNQLDHKPFGLLMFYIVLSKNAWHLVVVKIY